MVWLDPSRPRYLPGMLGSMDSYSFYIRCVLLFAVWGGGKMLKIGDFL